MESFSHGRLTDLIREELRLALRKSSPEEAERHIRVQQQIEQLLTAGLDEFPSIRPKRPNIHDN